MKIKYVPVENSIAEWGDKQALIKRFEGLNIYTLNRWLSEMRDSKQFRDGVVSPTLEFVYVNFYIFLKFLIWKQRH